MNVNVDQLATVLYVACLIEDRAGGEQRAMLDLALKVDKERAEFSATAPPPQPPEMVEHVEDTYAPSEGRRVALTAPQRTQLAALHAKFDECKKCGVQRGAHAVECLRADVEAYRAVHGPPDGQLV